MLCITDISPDGHTVVVRILGLEDQLRHAALLSEPAAPTPETTGKTRLLRLINIEQRRTRVRNRIWIPNPMTTLYYAEHVLHSTDSRLGSLLPILHRTESESESVPESVSDNVNESFNL